MAVDSNSYFKMFYLIADNSAGERTSSGVQNYRHTTQFHGYGSSELIYLGFFGTMYGYTVRYYFTIDPVVKYAV